MEKRLAIKKKPLLTNLFPVISYIHYNFDIECVTYAKSYCTKYIIFHYRINKANWISTKDYLQISAFYSDCSWIPLMKL